MKSWNWGIAWRDDKLYSFEPRSVLVMRLWPEMRAWRRTVTRPWSPTRKWADKFFTEVVSSTPHHFCRGWTAHKTAFVGPLFEAKEAGRNPSLCANWYGRIMERQYDKLEPALDTIPLREQKIATQLAERRWHALALMARCPGATDLFEGNPALAFALASNWVFHKPAVTQPMRSARSLVIKKQVSILDWLGFPATERVRRILMHITPGSLEVHKLLHLQCALHDKETQKLLAHLPVITKDIIRFVCHRDTRQLVTPRFLHQLSEDAGRQVIIHGRDTMRPFDSGTAHYFRLGMDALHMAQQLGVELPKRIPSIIWLQNWHEDLTAEYNDNSGTNITQLDFGPPPLPGTKDIEPLTTGKQLLDEGIIMRHCVASHHLKVVQGNYYVYRVLAPVRATLAIKRDGGSWLIDQIGGANNEAIPLHYQKSIQMQLFNHSYEV